MKYKIRKDVPLPKLKFKGLAKTLMSLDVGDSIFVSKKEAKTLSSYVHSTGARHSRKFAIRRERNGHRIWRTK